MEGWEILMLALGWVFVIEGLSPLVMPERWLAMLTELSKCDPKVIRTAAAAIVGVGLVIIWSFLDKMS